MPRKDTQPLYSFMFFLSLALCCLGHGLIHGLSPFSSAIGGGEGLFNLALSGSGAILLESVVPEAELIAVDLHDDVLKIDGSLAVAWSSSLQFTVERSSKGLLASAASGEGLVNVYRGTGRVLMSPVASTQPLSASTL